MPEVEKLLDKADATLEDAQKAYEEEMLVSTVQNRIYYSMYYAAQAALILQGVDVNTHKGIKVKIGEKLVLENKLEKKWGRFYSQQQTYREQADYQVDVDIERDDLEKYLEKTGEFIRKMKNIAGL